MTQETSFWRLVTDAADAAPDRVVLADDYGRSLTTAALRDAAERVAAGLPVRPGMVVSWQLPSTLEACVLMAALARAGAVQNPVIPVLREHEVAHIAKTAGTELFITAGTWRGFPHAEMARGLGLDVIEIEQEKAGSGPLRLPAGDPARLPAPAKQAQAQRAPANGSECRWLYFSSGTTAAPKGVRHSDATVMGAANGVVDLQGMHDGDVYPIVFPVTHIGGIAMITAVLRAGGRLVMFDRWDPVTSPVRAAAHRPTILGSAQPFFQAYLDAQRGRREPLYPDLRCFVAGGAPTPPAMLEELTSEFGIRGVINSWGLTEFPVATSAAHDDPAAVLARTAGRPAPGVEVRVADGELRLKGPQCFLGYAGTDRDAGTARDAGTDRDAGTARDTAFDAGGWFRTGDLGAIGADGNVTVTGRLKDVIIRNAENISAAEVEDVLRRHPAVADVAVIGLPDPRTGERVCAVVVPAAGREVTLAALAAHCAQQALAPYKRPVQLEVSAALPRNSMGKILRQQLKQQFA